MPHKVVYNGCYGGFSLSDQAKKWLAERGVECVSGLERHDKLLVECVETLGESASGRYSSLCIKTVDRYYRIDEYDGREAVIEPSDDAWTDPEG